MPNRLSTATSPYLLQHQNNPVDWFPWGEEAIETARREDKPIFLSIGYSACHWCHVMEHESFESPHIAAILNEFFVSIKVDREERPDLDHIYMQAVQMLTGSGGWPMSVFLTGELRPFYGGTYWPPVNRYGRPGFDQVLHAVANAWRDKREQIVEQSIEMTKQLELSFQTEASSEDSENAASLTHALLIQADRWLQKHFDSTYGGFGGAPKFPHAMDLALLLQLCHRQPEEHRLRVVTHTLDKMAQGGIYDHLAGGFARYSVDERWLVPHFEKMLYDNGLLIPLYADAYLVTGKALYREVVEQSLGYILREMTSPEGAFYSTEDADSEGEEGKFYVWSREEIVTLLGEKRGETFCELYDVTQAGNFEGHNILNLPKSIETFAAMRKLDLATFQQQVSEDRETLRLARAKRIRPGLDDKILVSWNALMIDALARCSRALGSKVYLDAAQKAARFIQSNMLKSDRRLLHTHRLGESRYDAYLDDYTYLANALISLYESDFDERWLQWAEELLGLVEKHFADPRGGYFFTADDHEALIARVKDSHDSSVPSGNAMAATAMIRLGRLTGEGRWLDAAEKNLKSLASLMARAPQAAGQALLALDLWLGPAYQLACVGSRDSELAREFLAKARKKFRPQLQIAWRDETSDHRAACMEAYWTGKEKGSGELAVYLCYNQTCQAPVSDRESLERLLNTVN